MVVDPQHDPEPHLLLLLQKLLVPARYWSVDSPRRCKGLNLGRGSHQEQQGTRLETYDKACPRGAHPGETTNSAGLRSSPEAEAGLETGTPATQLREALRAMG